MRTAPSLATRTKPLWRSVPTGEMRRASIFTGKEPSAARASMMMRSEFSMGRESLRSRERLSPFSETDHARTDGPLTARISPGPSRERESAGSLPWRTWRSSAVNCRITPEPMRTSVVAVDEKKSVPSTVELDFRKARAAEPLAGRKPRHAAPFCCGTMGRLRSKEIPSGRSLSVSGTTTPAGSLKLRASQSPLRTSGTTNSMETGNSPAASAMRS